MRLIALLLSICIATDGFGCDQPVKHLEQGEASPCAGFLFSPEKEIEVRTAILENGLLKSEMSLKDNKISLLEENSKYYQEIVAKESEKAELWRKRAEDSTEKLMGSEENRGKRDLAFLIGGILLTTLAGWSLGQVKK
jgi:hypothetical protein